MKRIIALMLVLMMAFSFSAMAEGEGGLDKDGVTNASGYPITNEVIKSGHGVDVCVRAGTSPR